MSKEDNKNAIEIIKQMIADGQISQDVAEKYFPELAESEDERIRKEIIDYLSTVDDKKLIPYESWIAWLEKQGEQNPADKVEPKFKVGDWVVDRNGIVKQILSYKDCIYKHTDGYSSKMFEDEWRLWDITKDAKDGDVLYHKAENGIEYIVMNKGLNEHNNIDSYFRYSSINGFGIDIPSVLSAKYDSITPATKEQCNQLEKAMADAGYTFDFEKKELKKIENPTVWSEEDEKCWSIVIAEFSKCAGKSVSKDEWMRCNDWLNSLRDRVQPKQEWSKEDEKLINRIEGWLDTLCDYLKDSSPECIEDVKDIVEQLKYFKHQNKFAYNPYKAVVESIAAMVEKYAPFDSNLQDFYDNVKVKCKDAKEYDSLFPQNRWKPSNEQMRFLLKYAEQNNYDGRILTSLYNDLKKLK